METKLTQNFEGQIKSIMAFFTAALIKRFKILFEAPERNLNVHFSLVVTPQVTQAHCVCHIGKYREHNYEAKFKSGNLLENGHKNR